MLNITAVELTALAAHYDDETADGFGEEVDIVKAALTEGDCEPSQEAFWEISGITHRSLERFEDGRVDTTGAYSTLNRLAEKLTAFEEAQYASRAWA